jgi:hypothetical protein
MEAAALVDAKLPFADESYCVDVKLLFKDESYCSWTNQNTAAWMRNCPSWMKTAGGGRTRTLSIMDGNCWLVDAKIALRR